MTTNNLNNMLTFDRSTLIWIIGLASALILVLSVADIAAIRFVDLGGIVTPAGAMLFAVIFVVRDMLHRLAGASLVKSVIKIAIVFNLFVGFYLYTMTLIPAPIFRPGDAFDAVFAFAPGIVIGSVMAALVSQYVNTYVYQWLWEKDFGDWQRTVLSNTISLPVDAVLFTFLAFVLIPPMLGAPGIDVAAAFARVVSGQTLFKLGCILALTPLIFMSPLNAKAREMK